MIRIYTVDDFVTSTLNLIPNSLLSEYSVYADKRHNGLDTAINFIRRQINNDAEVIWYDEDFRNWLDSNDIWIPFKYSINEDIQILGVSPHVPMLNEEVAITLLVEEANLSVTLPVQLRIKMDIGLVSVVPGYTGVDKVTEEIPTIERALMILHAKIITPITEAFTPILDEKIEGTLYRFAKKYGLTNF